MTTGGMYPMTEWLADPIKLVTAIIALVGLIFTWRKFREDSLRRGEVLAWADQTIAALEGLVMVCILGSRPAFADESKTRLAKIAFDTAILTERGRIFFKNRPHGTFGTEKKPAYRGLRPKVLDPLIAAHQIAVRLPDCSGEGRIRLQYLAEDYLKDFVSLIQSEIGRERTASQVANEGGSGFNLDQALAQVPGERVASILEMAGNAPGLYRKGAPVGSPASSGI